jgi:hypothetical protein
MKTKLAKMNRNAVTYSSCQLFTSRNDRTRSLNSPAIRRFIHKTPFHTGRKSSTTSSSQSRCFYFIYQNKKLFWCSQCHISSIFVNFGLLSVLTQDVLGPFKQDFFCFIPIASFESALQSPVMTSV